MRTLRRGDSGADVIQYVQAPLWRLGYSLKRDGFFGPITERLLSDFQKSFGLPVTGVLDEATHVKLTQVDPATRTSSDPAGSAAVIDTDSPFPPMSASRRAAVFGRFNWTPGNGDNIRILGNWQQENIHKFYIPQLDGLPYYEPGGSLLCHGYVYLHRLAGPIFQRFFATVEDSGLLDRIRCFDGAFVPRRVRGSKSVLSNHAWGTAVDINAYANGLGKRPAAVGRDGSVVELVPIAHACGLYWGGNFSRPDGMHFEVAVVS